MNLKSKTKKLAEYLEDQLGWEVYSKEFHCTGCKNRGFYGDKFCPKCGSKIKHTKKGLEDLEAAIKHAGLK